METKKRKEPPTTPPSGHSEATTISGLIPSAHASRQLHSEDPNEEAIKKLFMTVVKKLKYPESTTPFNDENYEPSLQKRNRRKLMRLLQDKCDEYGKDDPNSHKIKVIADLIRAIAVTFRGDPKLFTPRVNALSSLAILLGYIPEEGDAVYDQLDPPLSVAREDDASSAATTSSTMTSTAARAVVAGATDLTGAATTTTSTGTAATATTSTSETAATSTVAAPVVAVGTRVVLADVDGVGDDQYAGTVIDVDESFFVVVYDICQYHQKEPEKWISAFKLSQFGHIIFPEPEGQDQDDSYYDKLVIPNDQLKHMAICCMQGKDTWRVGEHIDYRMFEKSTCRYRVYYAKKISITENWAEESYYMYLKMMYYPDFLTAEWAVATSKLWMSNPSDDLKAMLKDKTSYRRNRRMVTAMYQDHLMEKYQNECPHVENLEPVPDPFTSHQTECQAIEIDKAFVDIINDRYTSFLSSNKDALDFWKPGLDIVRDFSGGLPQHAKMQERRRKENFKQRLVFAESHAPRHKPLESFSKVKAIDGGSFKTFNDMTKPKSVWRTSRMRVLQCLNDQHGSPPLTHEELEDAYEQSVIQFLPYGMSNTQDGNSNKEMTLFLLDDAALGLVVSLLAELINKCTNLELICMDTKEGLLVAQMGLEKSNKNGDEVAVVGSPHPSYYMNTSRSGVGGAFCLDQGTLTSLDCFRILDYMQQLLRCLTKVCKGSCGEIALDSLDWLLLIIDHCGSPHVNSAYKNKLLSYSGDIERFEAEVDDKGIMLGCISIDRPNKGGWVICVEDKGTGIYAPQRTDIDHSLSYQPDAVYKKIHDGSRHYLPKFGMVLHTKNLKRFFARKSLEDFYKRFASGGGLRHMTRG